MDSKAYIARRIERLDALIAERRGYVGPIWPSEHGETFGGWIGRFGPGKNVDDLLELRAKWQRFYDGGGRLH
jgi:hypothetical protein